MDEREPGPVIATGVEIPPWSNRVTYLEINQFAGANREWGLDHMDPEHARSVGLKDVIIMGNLKLAYVANMLQDWLGEDAWIQRIATSYRGLDYVGDELTSRGRVTGTFVRDGETYVECEIWVENQGAARNTIGSATVVLPRQLR